MFLVTTPINRMADTPVKWREAVDRAFEALLHRTATDRLLTGEGLEWARDRLAAEGPVAGDGPDGAASDRLLRVRMRHLARQRSAIDRASAALVARPSAPEHLGQAYEELAGRMAGKPHWATGDDGEACEAVARGALLQRNDFRRLDNVKSRKLELSADAHEWAEAAAGCERSAADQWEAEEGRLQLREGLRKHLPYGDHDKLDRFLRWQLDCVPQAEVAVEAGMRPPAFRQEVRRLKPALRVAVAAYLREGGEDFGFAEALI